MRVLPIAHTWDGAPVDDRAAVGLALQGDALVLRVLAPLHDDPPPSGPPGPTPGLWEHEVVELFVAGKGAPYLEVEVGPHGHHLVLQLADVRRPVATGLPLPLTTRRAGGWWAATARFPRAWLPPAPHRVNAYRIHGPPGARRHLAHAPLPGPAPDFHQPHSFPPLPPGGGDPAHLVAAATGVEVAHARRLLAGDDDDDALLGAVAASRGA